MTINTTDASMSTREIGRKFRFHGFVARLAAKRDRLGMLERSITDKSANEKKYE
jgi:hypothetical protein